MKTLNQFIFITFSIFTFSCSSTHNHKLLVIENELISKTFQFSKNTADEITVLLFDKVGSKKINITSSQSYFEFVINNQVISSKDKLWVFRSENTREMGNGGTEHILTFEGIEGNVEGLQVILFQQIFPGSTLIREKLELRTNGKSLKLNKKDNKLHFRFPIYTFKNRINDRVESTEIRIASWEKNPISFGDNKKGNHMYYPNILTKKITQNRSTVKGPISIFSNSNFSWLTAYEHASQDGLNGMFDKQKMGSGNQINDAMQGIKGVFNFPIHDDDFKFLGISNQLNNDNIIVSVDILRGGYLDGEIIDKGHPYSTVWIASGFYNGNNLEAGKAMIRNYLYNQICEKPASRIPEFYYNTWGMQRENKSKPLRGILKYERIFKEIDNAAELGVDIFVLDDGWNNAQGDWYPNSERFSEGLAPIKKHLDKYDIKMGLWYSPMGIDSTTQRYKKHQEWVVKDSEGNPIMAQWNHPAFDFVSDFFNIFIDDCKNMVDQGCRFMKWDAINTFYSSLPNLLHGSDSYSEEEIRARYEYLLPIYVVRAMEILTDYEPELIIEMDLTEARRVMVGLISLSQGKHFWMNNGASWYNDYTTYRTQSMRTIANEFAGIIPLELFTYANYPQNIEGCMEYNVNNSLLAGHGFWGNLQLMTSDEKKWTGQQVKLSKKVLPYLVNVNPEVIGKVGDSPEIYSIVNSEEAAGQIIVFTENPIEKSYSTEINSTKLLAVLNQSYIVENNQLKLNLNLNKKESSVAVFVLPNNGAYISIQYSTSPILNAQLKNNKLEYLIGSPGEQIVIWNKKNGKPLIEKSQGVTYEIKEEIDVFKIKISASIPKTKVIIKSEISGK